MMALTCKTCGNPGTQCICTSGDVAPEVEENINHSIRIIEEFHDAFQKLETIDKKLVKLAIAFHDTGNHDMSKKLNSLSNYLYENKKIMRDAFTYMITR